MFRWVANNTKYTRTSTHNTLSRNKDTKTIIIYLYYGLLVDFNLFISDYILYFDRYILFIYLF